MIARSAPSNDARADDKSSDAKAPEDHGYLKTELFERLAHELRGPAGVISGVLDELERSLGEHAGTHGTLLAMARRNVQKLLRTSERLARSSEIESGKLQLGKTRHDVAQLVSRAAQEAEKLEGRRNVKLVVSMPTETCMAEVDATWVSAAIGELVAQALRNASSRVEVQIERVAENVCITVRDDSHAKSLPPTERFTAPADRRDAGLSIPLVNDIARAHGGNFMLTMIEPHGVLATIELVAFESGRESADRSRS